ncbi:MAG TPA: NADH-dependent [FeFe] hydrogenase, group A6 [Kiritimatiellia bacterium]|nr:NADH-dependent [FeFe] hydrogenase, group A6 [Kiritimatiellia bacterium]HRU69468.1 NADH-dependent [FeFe] hydrogenase, group A6 [Kiritimatiellia bacterium]
MSNLVQLEINGIPVEVPAGTTILDAAKAVHVKIPTLCHHPDLKPWAACGICVVRNSGSPKLLRACCTEVAPGMKITTHDSDIVSVRRTVLELILANHPNDCLQCPRSGICELQKLAADFGIRENPFPAEVPNIPVDTSTPSIVLNPEKCVKCGRCAIVCQEMQNVWALEFIGRGEKTRMAPAADVTLNESPCIKCGQCSAHCPVGAIYERDQTREVWNALRDESKYCVVQIAPAVRVAIGEAFGLPPGTLMTGETYAGLRRLGFKAVFDTNYSADVTIMEEGSEFIKRFTGGGKLPLITSCCPAWTDWMEKYAQDFMDNFSTAKSPQQMLGVLAKTYYAEKMGIDPARIFMVSIMPCTAKKYEISRSENMFASGHQDVDVVLTTRELARMFKSAGIDFSKLEKEEADSILGDYTGAGTIFGVTGGVMEAALRTAYCLITGDAQPPSINFEAVRGMEGVKEATIDIKGTPVKIAVAHQMGNVEQVLDAIREDRKAGRKPRYDFIEVMACRGGCVGGGGQPTGATDEVRKARTAGIYTDDEKCVIRMSHLNPQVQKLYAEYLGAPLSEKAHHLLHNHYHAKKIYAK